MSYIILLTTVSSQEEAKNMAKTLVEQRLAACVNLVPQITSVYCWRDSVQSESEVLLLMKTKALLYDTIETWINENHPYECPELIMVEIEKGASAYLNWIAEMTLE